VGGTLGVSGLATLAGGASFGASGQASISSAGAYSGVGAAYSGNVTVGGTLGVTGAATFTARPSFAGKTPWDSGNFTPGNYAPISSPTFGVQISTPWIITTGPAAPASQGTYVSWNDASGGGQTFITCNPGVGGGGLILRTVNSTGSAELGRLAISATGALTVTGTTAMSFGAYGYISQGGAGTSPSVSNAPVSLYAPNGRVVAIEVDAISDRRLKTDVAPIDGSRALDFVRSVGSYSFVWKSDPDGKRRFGYMAQDLGKLGFHELLGQAEDAGLEETVDADGFVSPANHRFTVSYDQVVPIHSSVLRQLLERIEALEAKCQ
jgi:hypothetical protein